MGDGAPGPGRSALVLTVSDGVAAGVREDRSGGVVAERLVGLGFAVERAVVPDEPAAIREAVARGAAAHRLVVTTGGTGLTPRDITPQSVGALLDYQIPGIGEAMRAAGRASTPRAILSRSLGGVVGRSLVLVLPGSPAGAAESLDAVAAIVDHALDTLAGPFDHERQGARDADGTGGRGG